MGFNDFYLENFETVTTDNSYSTPGISSPHPFFHLDGSLGDFAVDSVDGDDELGVDGSGATGSSIYTTGYFELNFDPIALGYFPTHVGIVWTDGTPFSPVTFEAFDNTNNSLGSITLALGDGSFFGTTAEDTFFGATNASGISKFIIHDNGSINNLELDHIQYGTTNNVKSVPEPNSLSLLALVLLGYFALKNRKSHC